MRNLLPALLLLALGQPIAHAQYLRDRQSSVPNQAEARNKICADAFESKEWILESTNQPELVYGSRDNYRAAIKENWLVKVDGSPSSDRCNLLRRNTPQNAPWGECKIYLDIEAMYKTRSLVDFFIENNRLHLYTQTENLSCIHYPAVPAKAPISRWIYRKTD